MSNEPINTESDYYTKPYQFFSLRLKWEALLKEGKFGPWYFIPIQQIAFWREGRIKSCTHNGFRLAQWWRKNAGETDVVFYSTKETNFSFIFNNDEIALIFLAWYKELPESIKLDTSYNLWLGKDNFINQVEKAGEILLQGKIDVKSIMSYYNADILTEHIFDIFCWLDENVGQVYYWNNHFYFQQDSDAVAFKLRWL